MAYRVQVTSKRNQNKHRMSTLIGGSSVVACFVGTEGRFTYPWLPLGSSILASIDDEYEQKRPKGSPPTRLVQEGTA
jgi:hypothetical protein